MAAYLNNCRFNVTSGGNSDWVFASTVAGYQSPAAAGAVNGTPYKFMAASTDQSQWEIAEGAYSSATGTFTRTTVLYNSNGTGTASGQSGAGTKINFAAAPTVAIIGVKEDLISVEEANSFSAAQKARARANIGIGQSTSARSFAIVSSQVWTCQRSGRYRIKALGPGGGGGGYGGGGAVGAGGGAGGDCWSEVDLVVGDTLTITNGAPGVGGSPTTGSAGSDGGVTTVSGAKLPATMVANGGHGGAGRTSPGGVAGGGGGTASGGNLVNMNGAAGQHGTSMGAGWAFPGCGAGTRWGSGGISGAENVNASGGSAQTFGAGGGGGAEAGGSGGGVGGPSIVEIELIEAT